MNSAHEPWNADRGAAIIAGLSDIEGGTIVILHALQEAFGYVPEPAIPMIASALSLSRVNRSMSLFGGTRTPSHPT